MIINAILLLIFSLGMFGLGIYLINKEQKDKIAKKSKGTLYVYLNEVGEFELYVDLNQSPDKIALDKYIVLDVDFIDNTQK